MRKFLFTFIFLISAHIYGQDTLHPIPSFINYELSNKLSMEIWGDTNVARSYTCLECIHILIGPKEPHLKRPTLISIDTNGVIQYIKNSDTNGHVLYFVNEEFISVRKKNGKIKVVKLE